MVLEAWALHIMGIRQRIHAGCVFGPDDLTEAEWRGLVVLETVIAQVSEERMNPDG